MSSKLLEIDNLTVSYATVGGTLRALDGVSLSIDADETLAVVGESGSGKSTIALAVMGLLGTEASVSGAIRFAGRDVAQLTTSERTALRGRAVSIVFQDPFTSLNPSLTIGEQVSEPLIFHQGLDREQAMQRAVAALAEVALPSPATIIRAYPHQLSGGMQQRVLIATALICDPQLLVLDEPTTALDATVEAQILDLLDDIRRKRKLGTLFITHNIGVVNRVAHRVCVLYAGRLLELGDKEAVLAAPTHPYTQGLLASLPTLSDVGGTRRTAPIPGRFPDLTKPFPGCIFADRCPFVEERCREPQELITLNDGRKVRCWKAGAGPLPAWPRSERNRQSRAEGLSATPLLQTENLVKTFRRGSLRGGIEWTRRLLVFPWPQVKTELVRAVDRITLAVGRGETVGLVGESGSGKSTFGRSVLKLVEPNGGRILFDGIDVAKQNEDALLPLRKRAQIVFQNPDSSLNPRRRVGDAIARAVKLHNDVPARSLREHVETLLDHVGLPRGYYDRYPHQLSGGEKQRVGIARALATGPDFIVCDEPVSALDVSVQATILNLLDDLRAKLGLSYLFISHDLAVVAYIADRIAVMYAGRICEEGPVAAVLAPPHHPYTEALLSAVPQPTPRAQPIERIRLRGDPISAQVGETCCPFHPRCPRKIGTICETTMPPVVEFPAGHRIACHLPLEQLARTSASTAG